MGKINADKIIIIGNGFDLWQGLPTSYAILKNITNKIKKKCQET